MPRYVTLALQQTGFTLFIHRVAALQPAVVTFLQGIKQVRGGVNFTVVFDLFVALELHGGAVIELELVGRVLKVFFLDQHALERLGVKSESGTTLEPLLIGIQIDIFEIVVVVVGVIIQILIDVLVLVLANTRTSTRIRGALYVCCVMRVGTTPHSYRLPLDKMRANAFRIAS